MTAATLAMAARAAELAPAMLVYLDARLRVRFVNRCCALLLGHEPRGLVGKALGDLLDARTLRYALSHLRDLKCGEPASRDYVLRHRTGELKRIRLHAVMNRDPRGQAVGYVACGSRQAAVLNRAAAHDLRTPLAAVIAALDLVQARGRPEPDTTAGRCLLMAIDGADRLADAVEKWLNEYQ